MIIKGEAGIRTSHMGHTIFNQRESPCQFVPYDDLSNCQHAAWHVASGNTVYSKAS